MGAKGDDGTEGQPGDIGPMGSPGFKGDRGPRGRMGMKGATGAPGATGVIGERGARGEKGERGDPGMLGPEGISGEKGESGQQGIAGPVGLEGEKVSRVLLPNCQLYRALKVYKARLGTLVLQDPRALSVQLVLVGVSAKRATLDRWECREHVDPLAQQDPQVLVAPQAPLVKSGPEVMRDRSGLLDLQARLVHKVRPALSEMREPWDPL